MTHISHRLKLYKLDEILSLALLPSKKGCCSADGNLWKPWTTGLPLTWLKCSCPRSRAPWWGAAPRRSSRSPNCLADRLRLAPNTLNTSSLKASSGLSSGCPRPVAASSSSPATARQGVIVERVKSTAPELSGAGTRAGALVSVPLGWEGHRPASLPGPVSETLGARGPLQPQTLRALKN